MTTATLDTTRLTILPSGVRLVRLEEGEQGWLEEYDPILRVAATDFLQRAGLPGTPEGVLTALWEALASPGHAVWLVLDPAYRLIGFAWLRLTTLFGSAPMAFVPAVYLYPRKSARAALPALARTMRAWAATQGADMLYFESRRARSRAWARVGARPMAQVYALATKEAPDGR